MHVCLWVNVWAHVCITLTLRLSCWSIIIVADLKDDLWSQRGVRLYNPAKVNSGWWRLTDVQKLIFGATEGRLNHMFFPPTLVCSSFRSRHWSRVQRSIFNKPIMKKQACNPAARVTPSQPWLCCFPPLFKHILSVAVPQRPLFLQKHSEKIDTVETGWVARGLWSPLDQWMPFELAAILRDTGTVDRGEGRLP